MTRNLLLTGGPAHDFDATSAAVARLLEEQQVATTVVADPGEAFSLLRDAERGEAEPYSLLTVDALHWGMDASRYAHLRAQHAFHLGEDDATLLDAFVRRGGGLLALHTAVICFDGHPRWHELCGASWNWEASSHPPCGTAAVRVTPAGRDHELTVGLADFIIEDEVYGFLDEVDGIQPLLVSTHGGREHPLLWARRVGQGRVVTDLLGHGPVSFEHPTHRTILTRAAAWVADTDPGARATLENPDAPDAGEPVEPG